MGLLPRRFIRFLLLIGILFLPAFLLPGQEAALKTRVGVLPFSNVNNDPRLDALCHAATETIVLTLKLMGTYNVVALEEDASIPEVVAHVISAADQNRLDNVIFGSASQDEESHFIFEASVYDREKGRVSITQRVTADGVFEVFEAADKLVVSILESLSGMHIGFGMVVLSPAGEPGQYTVMIDGNDMGDNLRSVDKVLNGVHVITVRQKRMFGDYIVREDRVTIVEDGEVTLSFEIPLMIEEEKQALAGLEQIVQEGWESPERAPAVADALSQLTQLVRSTPYAIGLSARLKGYQQTAAEWEAQKVLFALEKSAASSSADVLEPLRSIYTHRAEYQDGEKIAALVRRDAGLAAALLALTAGRDLGSGRYAEAVARYEEISALGDVFGQDVVQQYQEELANLRMLSAGYEQKKKERNLWLPIVSLSGGLGLAAGGSYLIATGLDGQIAAEGNGLYSQYLTETNPAVLQSLHQQIESKYTLANVLGIGKWAGIGVGGALAGLGIWGIIAGDPQLWMKEQVRIHFGERIKAVGRLFDWRGNKAAVLVVTDPIGAEVRVGQKLLGPSPVVVETSGAMSIDITCSIPGGAQAFTVSARTDRGVVFVQVARDVKAPSVRNVSRRDDGAFLLEWEPVAEAAGYVVQIARKEAEGINALLHQADGVKESTYAYMPPKNTQGDMVFRVAALSAAGVRGQWSDAFDLPAVVAPTTAPANPAGPRWLFPISAGAAYRLSGQASALLQAGFAYRFWDTVALGIDLNLPFVIQSMTIGSITLPFSVYPAPVVSLITTDKNGNSQLHFGFFAFPADPAVLLVATGALSLGHFSIGILAFVTPGASLSMNSFGATVGWVF